MPRRIERALVTGASAGLGARFAHHLAHRGVAVTLVARRRDRLERLAADLPTDAEVLVADLATPAGVDVVADRLTVSERPIDLLVNGAGFGAYGSFADLPVDRQAEMVEVNVAAVVRLTHAALRQQLTRGGGGVINVGSTAAYQPDPFGAVYGATKAFVRSFSEALHEELRGTDVHVMLLSPGVTDTEFQEVAGVAAGAVPAVLRMTADAVVSEALRDFGRRRAVCVPGVTNKLNVAAVELTPSAVSRRASRVVHERYTA